jgi:hypothetical protein
MASAVSKSKPRFYPTPPPPLLSTPSTGLIGTQLTQGVLPLAFFSVSGSSGEVFQYSSNDPPHETLIA